MVVSEALRQSGLEVCEAESGAQALELLRPPGRISWSWMS